MPHAVHSDAFALLCDAQWLRKLRGDRCVAQRCLNRPAARLQGPGTDKAPLRELREATAQGCTLHCATSLIRHAVPLQGPGTDEAPLRELREAIARGRACVVQLMNYRRNGDAFVNYLSVTPIHDAGGALTHYVGIQADITELVNHKNAELAAKHAAVQARALNPKC